MKKSILVVDDEFYITRSLSFMFKRAGYVCETVYDGRAALEFLKKQKPDLIFLDVDMPLMNGYETARAIGANPALNHIPIIMLTAKGQEIDSKKGFDAGAREYIFKPFEPKILLQKVKEIIG